MKLWIKVTPNARTSEITGWDSDEVHGRVLRVRVAAPPVDGKANDALCQCLARSLGVPKSKITVERGSASRVKVLEIPDNSRLPP